MNEDVIVRRLVKEDLEELTQLSFATFADVAFTTNTYATLQDLQEYETTRYLVEFELNSPFVYGIGMTLHGRIIAMAFIKKVDITALDLVIVHPDYQDRGIGNKLLSEIAVHTKEDFSVRMLADVANKKVCAMFSNFGMEFKEIITVLSGDNFVMDAELLKTANPNYVVRLMTDQDVSTCSSLHVLVNNFPRTLEMAMLTKDRTSMPHVLERNGVIVGYSCGFTYTGHTCCLDKTDFFILLAHYKFINKTSSSTNFLSKFHLFLPANIYPDILTSCLRMGMKIDKMMVMMVKGGYYPPREGCIYTQSIIW